MQKIIIVLFIFTSLLIVSCGGDKTGGGTLAQKKATLDSLKKEQVKINDAIVKLQDDIAKIDTSAALQNTTLVSVKALAPETFVHYIDLQGKVEAVNISYVTPRNGTGGQVKALYVQKGQQVKKGQLLLQLDDVIAKQNLRAAQQGLVTLQTQLDYAKDVYRRQKNLWDQGIGTEIQVITDKNNVDNLESQLKTTQEQINMAQEQVNFTSVYSDVAGVAEDVNVRVGEIFAPAAQQIKIVNTYDLKVTTQVPENYVSKVNVGDNVLINFPDLNKTITAKISVAGKVIDPNSRSFYVEIHLPSDRDLKPNLIANVKIQDYSAANVISVPVNTVQTDDKGKYVFVAVTDKDKIVAKKKPVVVGQSYGNNAEIFSGLLAGDKIITEGFQSLYDGQPVTMAQ